MELRGGPRGCADRDSAGARTRTVRADGRTLCYAEYGDSAGRPVLFLHGVPGSRVLGELFDAPSQDCGLRIIAPDRPGFGRSEPWSDWDPTSPAGFVTAVLDDAGVEAVDVVCFSGGSACAYGFAASFPDRVGRVDVVSGAVPPSVLDSQPRLHRLLGFLAERTPRVLAGLFRTHAMVARHSGPSIILDQYTTGKSPCIPDSMADVVVRDFHASFANSRTGAVVESSVLADWGLPAELPVSIHLWHGRQDTKVPVTGARRVSDRLPDGEITVIDDADHLGAIPQALPAILSAHE